MNFIFVSLVDIVSARPPVRPPRFLIGIVLLGAFVAESAVAQSERASPDGTASYGTGDNFRVGGGLSGADHL